MIPEERTLLRITAKVWSDFRKLEELHPDDSVDFKFHIHALQNIILSRQATRELRSNGL